MVYQQNMKSKKSAVSLLEVLRKPPYINLALEREKDSGRETTNFANAKVKPKGKKLPKK